MRRAIGAPTISGIRLAASITNGPLIVSTAGPPTVRNGTVKKFASTVKAAGAAGPGGCVKTRSDKRLNANNDSRARRYGAGSRHTHPAIARRGKSFRKHGDGVLARPLR